MRQAVAAGLGIVAPHFGLTLADGPYDRSNPEEVTAMSLETLASHPAMKLTSMGKLCQLLQVSPATLRQRMVAADVRFTFEINGVEFVDAAFDTLLAFSRGERN